MSASQQSWAQYLSGFGPGRALNSGFALPGIGIGDEVVFFGFGVFWGVRVVAPLIQSFHGCVCSLVCVCERAPLGLCLFWVVLASAA